VDDITRLVAELPPMLGALGRQPQQAGLSRWSAPVRAIEPSLRVGS
jgi:hypothetical protein